MGAPLRAKKNSGAKKNKKEGNEKRRKTEKRKERRNGMKRKERRKRERKKRGDKRNQRGEEERILIKKNYMKQRKKDNYAYFSRFRICRDLRALVAKKKL